MWIIENEKKKDILAIEEDYISEMKDNAIQRLEDNILKLQDDLAMELKELNQEKVGNIIIYYVQRYNSFKGYDSMHEQYKVKLNALQSFVACYGVNLGLHFEKSKDGGFLIIFEGMNRLNPKDTSFIEMRYDDDTDAFTSKSSIYYLLKLN